jgi:5-methylcytosine-specific restriction endonuclease McrA
MADKLPIYRTARTAAFSIDLAHQVQCPRWRKLRRAFLQRNPLCAACEAAGQVVAANVVHHKIDRADRPDLAYEWANLEALCEHCHNRETNERKKAP